MFLKSLSCTYDPYITIFSNYLSSEFGKKYTYITRGRLNQEQVAEFAEHNIQVMINKSSVTNSVWT